jgi:hypothetical protein
MAVGIFEGHRSGYDSPGPTDGAFLFCTVTEWAFGPLFDCADDCREFLTWLDGQRPGVDVRTIAARELQQLHAMWLLFSRRKV